MIKYGIFQPIGSSTTPELPYDAVILRENGEFQNITINHSRDYIDHGDAVAIKIAKPDPVKAKVNEIVKAHNIIGVSGRRLIELAVRHMMDQKVDGQPWIEQKLDELCIFSSVTREKISKWYRDPETYRSCPLLDNKILTVKPLYSGNARVIVTPRGDTLAYTTAQKIYWAIHGPNYWDFSKTTVGENIGGRIRHTSMYPITISKRNVQIGCQVIPIQAIEDLAKNQSWPKTPPHGAY